MITYNAISELISDKSVIIQCLESVDSTNTAAKKLAAENTDKRIIVTAEAQTGGRGRNGKDFYSPAGSGLYMSVVIHPPVSASDAVSVTTRASVAVARAIEEITDKVVGIKWVNDIILGGKKVGGILTEAVSDYKAGTLNSIIIGVGLNLATDDFPPELTGIAGSLSVSESEKSRLAAAIANNIFDITENLAADNYIDEYRKRSVVTGRQINYSINGNKNSALAIGVDDKGGLIIQKNDGTQTTLSSGEISIRIK